MAVRYTGQWNGVHCIGLQLADGYHLCRTKGVRQASSRPLLCVLARHDSDQKHQMAQIVKVCAMSKKCMAGCDLNIAMTRKNFCKRTSRRYVRLGGQIDLIRVQCRALSNWRP